ncbi:MAG: acylneuraminate cytidylyltransferase family protein [Alphaproteobacteria bacterium]|nr:acylneuraminate cytidylyltransferase family protein [Alphaproteobacteria bacterium]
MPLYDNVGKALTIVGVIPARGGSKGLPGKNILPLANKPMIGHVIDAAKNAQSLNLVVVSTEDDEIADVSRNFGVRVIERPLAFASDTAPIDLALRHVVRTLEDEGANVDIVVWLQANAPTTSTETIEEAIQLMVREGCDSVQTVIPYRIPPQWAWRMEGNQLKPLEGCYKYTVRRQDATQAYHLDGAVNVLKRSVLMESEGQPGQAYFGLDRRAIVQDPSASVEVDDRADYEYARFFFESRTQK